MREIKLAQRIATENQDADFRPKEKSRVFKAKMSKVRESKINKEREKSTQKERKKIRDDVAHLLEVAEKKYFEAVQQVMKSNEKLIYLTRSICPRFWNFDVWISILFFPFFSFSKKRDKRDNVTNVNEQSSENQIYSDKMK